MVVNQSHHRCPVRVAKFLLIEIFPCIFLKFTKSHNLILRQIFQVLLGRCQELNMTIKTPKEVVKKLSLSDHRQCLSVTDSLTHSVMLIDVTRASEYANSKLAEVVTVADDSDEDRVGKSLLQIWKLRLVIKHYFCSDFEHKILKLKFRQDFEAEVWLVFCC